MADDVTTQSLTPGTVPPNTRISTHQLSSGAHAEVVGIFAGTGTPTSVGASITDTALLASNQDRRGASIFNDSSANLYVLAGSGAASTNNYTALVPPMGLYEVPFGYWGPIRGIWSAAVGNARVTEFS